MSRSFSTDSLQESEDGKIDLPEDEPAVVKLLMQYLYEGEYEPLLPDTESSGTIGKAVAKATAPRPDKAPNGRYYNYGFPHTCVKHYAQTCPHHNCADMRNYWIEDWNCDACNPLTPPVPSLNGTSDQLLTHAKMYEIADKYDVMGLKDLVKAKFTRACQNFWDDPAFAKAAYHAFSTTPGHDKGLRDIISKTIADHMKSLVSKPEIEA
jgi:hypothetical protein